MLEAERRVAEHAANAAQYAVGQRHQRDEGQHHRADRDGEFHAGLRPLRGGHDDVCGLFLVMAGDRHGFARRSFGQQGGRPCPADPGFGQMNVPLIAQGQFALHRKPHVRHHDLGHQQSAGRGHEAGGEEIVDLDPHGCVSGEDRAGNACHAAGHHRE